MALADRRPTKTVPARGVVHSGLESCGRSTTSRSRDYNQPGCFTALIGFEWTSTPDGARTCTASSSSATASDKADQVDHPISQFDSYNPEELWLWLADYEDDTGGQVLAIPHNGNLSNGLMFDDVTFDRASRLTETTPRRRQRWEPLYEVTQTKGDGEAHPTAVARRRVRRLRHLGQGRASRSRRRRRTCCRTNTHGRR